MTHNESEKTKKLYHYKSFWLLVLFTIYLLIGFFYAPKVIEQQLKQQLNTQLNMQTEVQKVRFNPLTFNTKLEQLSINDSNGQNWFSAQEVELNFDPLNLLWRQWQFSDLNLNAPKINLVTDEAGQILVPALPEIKANSDEPLELDLAIEDINIQQGKINLQADNVKKDFALSVKSLKFNHEKFSLADEDTRFELMIATENDEIIELKGQYNHIKQLIQSQLELKNWQATTLNQILPDELAINNQQGLIQANGSIDWPLIQKPVLNFETVKLQGIDSHWHQSVNLVNFSGELRDIKVDTETQTVDIVNFDSNQAEWQINWPIVLEPADTEQHLDADEEQGKFKWQVNVSKININDWPVTWIDNEINQTLPLSINTLEINGVNNSSLPFQMDSVLTVASHGQVSIHSEQTLQPLALTSQVDVTELALSPMSPWIEAQSGLVFAEGLLNTHQQFSYQDDQFTFEGTLNMMAAKIENNQQQNIMTLGQLDIGATQISSANKTIVIDQITLDQASGNVIIDSDKNLNIQNLSHDEPEQAGSEPSDWVIKVGAVNVKDLSTALIDQSVEPAVTTSISEVNGHIKGLSSESLSKADVDLSGKFNQFSPMHIKGQINPLSSEAYTDLKIAIQDLDLLAFSPYSSNYLAFPVIGGKLNIELEYNLNKNELHGKNNLLFKQFKLGNRTASPDAVNLPLKLAVSLLTDLNGEMKIDLPVSGNLNDPEFSYGGLIGKAFFKLITTIVASPFKILAALIPNPDPNLSDIQFTSGSAELFESEQSKLNQIAQIMSKKTELNLQLNPQLNADYDNNGLKLNLLLQKAPFDSFDLANPEVTSWLEVQLTPEELDTYRTEQGIDHHKIWQALINRQQVSEQHLQALTEQRNLAIKNYLIETAGISAEKIFIEQAQSNQSNQSLIKIGVSN
ncbi:MAG: DUF748 domain-containing protein [Marinicella sp.]